MDIINLDFSYTKFLDLAKSDNESAEILLHAKKYHNAVYHFQQSVEKSCKYIGLTNKIFTFIELRKINHDPHKVFDKLFSSVFFTSVCSNGDYKSFKNDMYNLNTDEIVKFSYTQIQNIIKNPHKNRMGKLASEIVLDYYINNPFAYCDSSIPLLLENVRIMRGYSKCERICEQLIKRNDEIELCMFSQMLMSFLVRGVEANSRYPDEDGTSPCDIYSGETLLVHYLSYFIEIQKFCVKTLYDYYNYNL